MAGCTQQGWQITGEGVYEGSLVIEGELIMKDRYVNDIQPHIKVDPKFIKLLPKPDKTEYLLKSSQTEATNLPDKLRLEITKIVYPMEGSPIMTFSNDLSGLK